MICLYVVYSGEAPRIPRGCPIVPVCSPAQDYSELWAHRKIWRECPCDAVGIFHARRYLDLSRPVLALPAKKRPLPYCIVHRPDFGAYSPERLNALMERFDVIAPVAERTGIPVRKRFDRAPHRAKDLDLACRILLEKRPEFAAAVQEYLSGDMEYYGNLFLMRWSFFDDYCSTLFDVLERFEAEADDPPPRTPGYLGERLFGIYFTWLQKQGGVRCGEVPRAHFWCYDDARHHLRRDRWINLLLPPSSRRRIFVKKIISHH